MKLKSYGLSEGTLKFVSDRLRYIARHCNLDDSREVLSFITSRQCSLSYKESLVKAYSYYARCYNIQYVKPRFRYERKLPKIPTRENIMKIISASKKYGVIFKVLMETGIMPHELSKVRLEDIDFENNILTVRGFKGHCSRVFKLPDDTIAMLRTYFNKYSSFPESKWICKMWIKTRNKVASKLHDSSIKSIRLYDLRHYYATMLYNKTKDILYVKQQLGHKKLETTLIYTQLVDFPNDEYYSAIASNIEEAKKLIENGFEYICDFNGVKLFRKRK
ncbi:MAG: tyrosine-type recombinase/integrase [Candidatus Micrarchaeia archaeon]